MFIKNRIRPVIVLLVALLVMLSSSCEKLLDNNPSGAQLLDTEVYKDSVTVKGALVGLYNTMGEQVYGSLMSTLPGLSADELQFVGNTYDQFVGNAIIPNDPYINILWAKSYTIIYSSNAIIEGVASGSNLSPTFSIRAIAEAKFMRALCYFYLVNLFGDIPLALTTHVEDNKLSPRIPVEKVYDQIIEDLKFAQLNLPADYSLSSGTRTRANKWAATALLSRVYLYIKDWEQAEKQASEVLNNTRLYKLEEINAVFTPKSNEAILQFYNNTNGYTIYASDVLPNPAEQIPKFVFTEQLKKIYNSNPQDKRKIWSGALNYNGVEYNYPAKYKSLALGSNAEYFTILRLAELYLVRAEARVQLNRIQDALNDISLVRQRAGLGPLHLDEKNNLLDAVEAERRMELSNEMGHRWFDLKRKGVIDAILKPLKPNWKASAALYPIPADQRARNSSLTQNPGYN